jgi:hypothetical protein
VGAGFNPVLPKYQALDEEYDRKTDHGRNQGATLL